MKEKAGKEGEKRNNAVATASIRFCLRRIRGFRREGKKRRRLRPGFFPATIIFPAFCLPHRAVEREKKKKGGEKEGNRHFKHRPTRFPAIPLSTAERKQIQEKEGGGGRKKELNPLATF